MFFCAGIGRFRIRTIFVPKDKAVKQSKYVKTKILLGYLLTAAVAVVAVRYIYGEMEKIARVDEMQTRLQAKRSLITRTLYHLYQTESYGQLMLAGYLSYENRYVRELGLVQQDIDSLRTVAAASGDSLQMMRMDSISVLLRVKARSTFNLRSNVRKAASGSLYNENIERILSENQPLVPDTVSRGEVVITSDTVRTVNTQSRKRTFLRRLADLFSPEEPDTNVVITYSTRIVTDTLPFNPADTIAGVLRNLQGDVDQQRQQIYDQAWEEGRKMRYSSQIVNQKINQLILDVEEEITQQELHRMALQHETEHHAARVVGGIAIGAVVLMLFFLLLIWRDIGRGNRYRRELEAANRYAEELLALRERLMLTITHDIKAPLGSVIGYIDLLSRLVEDKRQRLYLQNMKDSSEHLLRLVNQLLDFHRLDCHKMDINRVAFDPGRLFETIAAGYGPVAENRGVKFRYEPGKGLDAEFMGDPFRIRQVTDNLLSNAFKFTDRGEVVLSVGMEAGNWLCVSVRDTGRGIDEAEQEKIFQEFVRLPSAQGVEGFGLGLSITRKLVELLGGRLSLQSRKGAGSTFTVRIPLERTATVAAGSAGEKSQGEIPAAIPDVPAFTGLSCLLVDDDPLQLELMQAMCARLGLDADRCGTPEYAAEMLRRRTYDLIFTDLQMPSMDGFGLLARVREVNETIPVVAVSARSDQSRERMCEEGFADALCKPFRLEELRACVARVTGRESGVVAPVSGNSEANSTGNLDFGALTAFAGDDRKAAADILGSFVAQSRENRQALSDALKGGDMATIRALAHKMLPVFTMLSGGSPLTVILKSLEMNREGLTDEVRRQTEEAIGLIADVIEKAEKELTLLQNEMQ